MLPGCDSRRVLEMEGMPDSSGSLAVGFGNSNADMLGMPGGTILAPLMVSVGSSRVSCAAAERVESELSWEIEFSDA